MFHIKSSQASLSLPRLIQRALLTLSICLLPTFCSPPTVSAQSATATVSGVVADEKQAVIASATITAVNEATRLTRKATSNADGYFTIPLLPPGNYTLTVERDGFAQARVPDVVLNVGDQRAIQIQLKVGQVGETVTVTAGSELQESAAVGTVVNRQFVENLPLNGRSFQSLISLTPGVLTSASSGTEPGQFSVNGQRTDANYFTIDGVSANASSTAASGLGQTASGATPATSALGGTNNLVSVDALQEFRIQTSTYAPEFGRSPGAQVQIVTRPGTNRFTGSIFDYFRNGVLDANDWFANSRNTARSIVKQNDFGGVLGGPIVKNKTFFFFSYEGLRLRQPSVGLSTVPNLCLRGTGTCPAGQSPAAASLRPLVNAFPLPNGRDFGNGLAEFNAGVSNPTTLDATSIRVDHNLSDKVTLFGRYNHAPSESAKRGAPFSLSNVVLTGSKTDTLTMGATWVISPSSSNEFRFNYSRIGGSSVVKLDNFGGAVPPPESVFFPSPLTSSDASGIAIFLNATVGMGAGANNIQRQINVVDNYSILHGSHSLKFGVDYRRLSPTFDPINYSQFGFFSAVSEIVAGAALFVQVSADSNVDLFFTNFSAYGQDTWKINPRLTLTYGLRWELNPPPTGKKGMEPFAVTNFDNFATFALAPRGTALYKTTYNNFAPRIGLSYQLSQKTGRETVLRGGFGLFYDTGTSSAGNVAVTGSFPFGASRNAFFVPYPLTPVTGAPPAITTTPPVSRITALDPDLKLPIVYQWNVAAEQSLGSSRALSASYVGAAGRRLLQQGFLTNINATFPGSNFLITNGDTSDYHALQLQFKQRLTAGLQALISHTWSHSIDTASTDNKLLNVRQLGADVNKGSSDFDIRHNFSAAVTYNFPKPSLGPVGNALLRDWSVDTIVGARTAFPVNVVTGATIIVNGQNLSGAFRPDLVPGVPLYIDDPAAAGGRRINRAAFVIPPPPATAADLRQGTLGRNALRGFGFWQLDVALRRQFSITERVKLQLRGEFFNLFNHPNFSNPSNSLTNNPRFGESLSMLNNGLAGADSGQVQGGFNPLYQVGGPRSVQLALKLSF